LQRTWQALAELVLLELADVCFVELAAGVVCCWGAAVAVWVPTTRAPARSAAMDTAPMT
jgi:hypothetical protein